MVDQLTLQTFGIFLAGISLTVAAIYYTLTLRNQNRTRQAQLLMNLYETYRSKEFRADVTEVRNQEWTDFDDFWEKYGEKNNPDAWAAWISVAAFFNGVGVLLKRKLIDIVLVEDLLSNVVFGSWSRMYVPLYGYRKWQTRSVIGQEILHGFEYLYEKLSQRATPVARLTDDNNIEKT